MIESIFTWMLAIAGVYLAAGLLFSIPFVLKGVGNNDPAVHGSTIGFRLIIIPGVILLWPILARRWASHSDAPPEETSPHRIARTS